MVDDHSLEYFGFEGIIPEGQYGAGAVVVWDWGEYRLIEGNNALEALEGGKMIIELGGNILKGGFTLVRMKGRGENNWLLIKKRDAHSRTEWTIQRALTKAKQAELQEKMPPCKAH
jgi:bifunctional non-homologous end joining protein LigD